MRLEQIRWKNSKGWEIEKKGLESSDKVQLVLVFGSPDLISAPERYKELKHRYPNAHIVGGSTAGNVIGTSITDNDIVATAVYFEKSNIKTASADIDDHTNIQETVSKLVTKLHTPDLRHILVLSDGLNVNGTELAKGVNIFKDVPVTGGLLGDNGRFKETFVLDDMPAKPNRVVLVGFYGKHLLTGHGCFAGFREFGVDRIITKSKGRTVYEIDGQPALSLYKKYLGEFADQLPESALRFPLSIRKNKEDTALIRTVLAIDEKEQTLGFAGDMPEGSIGLLMKGNTDDLIDGAGKAADLANLSNNTTGLAIVISCVGRKLVMDQMAGEELEIIQNTLGKNTFMTGFYSYGELAPHNKELLQCRLHNQTMTLTSIYEE